MKNEVEQAAESRFGTDIDSIRGSNPYDLNTDLKRGFVEGAKWLKERMYSEKKVEELGIGDVNFRLLLEKYIKYVMEAEGSDIIRYGKEWGTNTEFTEQEWIMLTEISIKVNGT